MTDYVCLCIWSYPYYKPNRNIIGLRQQFGQRMEWSLIRWSESQRMWLFAGVWVHVWFLNSGNMNATQNEASCTWRHVWADVYRHRFRVGKVVEMQEKGELKKRRNKAGYQSMKVNGKQEIFPIIGFIEFDWGDLLMFVFTENTWRSIVPRSRVRKPSSVLTVP